MRIPVIYEDGDFLVLDKPAGIAVHRGSGVKEATIVDWLVRNYPEVKTAGDNPAERPGIVHRLDKDTSGVIVAARNQKTFEEFKRLFKERRIEKTYLALALGAPKKKSGSIESPLGRLAKNPLKRGAGAGIRGARQAVTKYRLLERLGDFSLLEVRPQTGRTHQIRVHLAHIGCPVAGDRAYGRGRRPPPWLDRQFLHAWRLEFSYPPGRRLRFESPLPQDLAKVLNQLRRLRKQTKNDM